LGTISPFNDLNQPKNRGVLIVDDQRIMRLILTSILNDARIPILGQATNGLEALELYAQLKPTVVLLDLVMPMMDGFATMEKLLNYDPKTNIVICSSLQQKFFISRALKTGAKEFLVKPFRKEQVQTIVNRMLLGTNVIHQYPRYLMLD
jgi:two-component system chemotaxis response regulator CheY